METELSAPDLSSSSKHTPRDHAVDGSWHTVVVPDVVTPVVVKPIAASDPKFSLADAKKERRSSSMASSDSIAASFGLYNSYLEPGFRSVDPGSWFWLVIVLVPSLFLLILFGLIPLNDPYSTDLGDFATFTLVVCPVTMGVLMYFHIVAFLFSVQVDRPFRAKWQPVLTSMAVVALCSTALWAWEDDTPIIFFGLAMYALAVVFAYFVLYHQAVNATPAQQNGTVNEVKHFLFAFLKVEIAISAFVLLLSLYVISWRYADDRIQRFLPVGLALFTFIFRKILLAITEPFPIEPAMLISGFWVENLEDMFQVMAFPSVTRWTSFFIIWVVPNALNLANLLFLTERWFAFRIWVKEFLKRLFCCGRKGNCCDVHEIPDLTDKPDDRGHSNNHPGYRRRQVRFYIWKMLSQLFSMVFYLTVTPILRFGANKDYYPFNGNEENADDVEHQVEYDSTLIYTGVNTIFVVLAGVGGMMLVKEKYRETWDQLIGTHTQLFVDHKYVGFVVAIVLHNGMVAISMLTQHNQIWYAFPPPND